MPRIGPSLALFFVASSQDFDGELLRDEDYVVEGSHGTNQTHQCARARAHTHTHMRDEVCVVEGSRMVSISCGVIPA